jgi:hypothetical protein
MVPWLTLYMDTCGDVGTVGQCRSCCMHTHSAIYIAHTLVRTKAEYMCMHPTPTPTQTIERRANTPSTVQRRALVQCTAVAIRARKQARRAALIIRMSHIQHRPKQTRPDPTRVHAAAPLSLSVPLRLPRTGLRCGWPVTPDTRVLLFAAVQLFDLRWLRRRTVSGVPAWPLSSSSVSLKREGGDYYY